MTQTIAIIGGSGFYTGIADGPIETAMLGTPFGPPSGPLSIGTHAGRRVVFLPRHGTQHTLLPSEVNTRANIWALKSVGATRVISVSAVGSLREHIAPGDVVVPRQFIDRTTVRPSTFFGQGVVAHVGMADPVCELLATHVANIGSRHARVHAGTYVCIEGPQFSTRAESELYRTWGADVVGMTNLPEARLAREAELCYATLTLPTDYDCWKPRGHVNVVDVLTVLRGNIDRARAILVEAIASIPDDACSCQRVLDDALITPVDAIPAEALHRLGPILARRCAR